MQEKHLFLFIMLLLCFSNIGYNYQTNSTSYVNEIFIAPSGNTSSSNYHNIITLQDFAKWTSNSSNYILGIGIIPAIFSPLHKVSNQSFVHVGNITVDEFSEWNQSITINVTSGWGNVNTNATLPAFFNITNLSILVSGNGSIARTSYDSSTRLVSWWTEDASSNVGIYNQTLNFSAMSVREENASAGNCTNYAQYSYYCKRVEHMALDIARSVHHHHYRSFLNVSDSIVESNTVIYKIPSSRFDNWALSQVTSYSVNDSSANLSLTSNATHVILTINQRLKKGIYKIDVSWDYYTTVGLSPGAGEVPVTPVEPVLIGEINLTANWTQLPKEINLSSNGGEYFLESLTLLNPTNQEINISIYFSTTGITEAFKWAHQLDDEMKYTNETIKLKPGSPDKPSQNFVNIEIHVPDNVPQYLYKFWINSENILTNVTKKTLVTIDTRTENKIVHDFNNFMAISFVLSKPIMGIEKITVLDILLIIVIIVAAIAGYFILKKLYKNKSKPAKENPPETQTA